MASLCLLTFFESFLTLSMRVRQTLAHRLELLSVPLGGAGLEHVAQSLLEQVGPVEPPVLTGDSPERQARLIEGVWRPLRRPHGTHATIAAQDC